MFSDGGSRPDNDSIDLGSCAGSGERSSSALGSNISVHAGIGDLLPDPVWPSITESLTAGKGAPRRLMMIPQQFQDWQVDSTGYRPTTEGGIRVHKKQVEDDIKRQLFDNSEPHMKELALASDRLDAAIATMMSLPNACTKGGVSKGMVPVIGREEGDENFCPVLLCHLDSCFNHSWTLSGPGSGWFWIPKGCLDLSERYPDPASRDEIRCFGHSARRVRVFLKPPPLTGSFVSAVTGSEMAN